MPVTLPWPHKALWPNGRAHFMRKAVETKKHRAWAWAAAKEAGLTAPDGRIPVLLKFFPKPKGPLPDKDNAMASGKALLDGIAQAMGVDDRLFDPRVEIVPERLSKVEIYVGDEEI
jgi:crossover junction endodeoxyribonuclease RusA